MRKRNGRSSTTASGGSSGPLTATGTFTLFDGTETSVPLMHGGTSGGDPLLRRLWVNTPCNEAPDELGQCDRKEGEGLGVGGDIGNADLPTAGPELHQAAKDATSDALRTTPSPGRGASPG